MPEIKYITVTTRGGRTITVDPKGPLTIKNIDNGSYKVAEEPKTATKSN